MLYFDISIYDIDDNIIIHKQIKHLGYYYYYYYLTCKIFPVILMKFNLKVFKLYNDILV